MSRIAALLRLWGNRLLWRLLAGSLTVLVALLPEGLVYHQERIRLRLVEEQVRDPREPFLIEPWDQLSKQERYWHWSPAKYAATVHTFSRDLLAGNLHYTLPYSC